MFVCSNNVCIQCPQLTHTGLTETECACVCVCVRVRGYGRDEVSLHHRLGTAFADVYTRKQINTHTHTYTQGAWQRGGGGRMQGLAVPLFHTVCVCVCVRAREREKCMVFPSEHDRYLG